MMVLVWASDVFEVVTFCDSGQFPVVIIWDDLFKFDS